MRKNQRMELSQEYKIMVVDDEEGILDSIQALLNRNGYWCACFSNPLDALEELKREHYDLLILDYFMQPIHGEEVVQEIRKTNSELYILLLTGHKDLAPPISTIKSLDIQAYCEKSDRLDQLLLLVESGIKSIGQMRTIQKFRDGLNSILGAVPKIYQLQPIGNILEEILRQILPLVNSKDAFILIDDLAESGNANKSIFRGIGAYHVPINRFTEMLDPIMMENIGFARTNGKRVEMENGTIFPLENEYLNSIGVLYVEGQHSTEGTQLLALYANQAASSSSSPPTDRGSTVTSPWTGWGRPSRCRRSSLVGVRRSRPGSGPSAELCGWLAGYCPGETRSAVPPSTSATSSSTR